jgi:hypothetical protein
MSTCSASGYVLLYVLTILNLACGNIILERCVCGHESWATWLGYKNRFVYKER